MEQGQLLSQPRFVFAQRIDPTADRRHMLAKVQIQALNKTRIDLLTALGQDRLDGLCRAEYHPVFDAHDASTPVGFVG